VVDALKTIQNIYSIFYTGVYQLPLQHYQGQLQGIPVAIKRCFIESSPERLSDFETEIKFIPKLQHRNIVKLQGYCIEGRERILVYEYMRNQSLDKFIFGMFSVTSFVYFQMNV
jgi:serine/threonine protein kinase